MNKKGGVKMSSPWNSPFLPQYTVSSFLEDHCSLARPHINKCPVGTLKEPPNE